MEKRPEVGAVALLHKNGTLLLGKRLCHPGFGLWCGPAGRIEYQEELEECLRREIEEECGLSELGAISFIGFDNHRFPEENGHIVLLYALVEYAGGQPVNREPEMCAGWEWRQWDDLPEPLLIPPKILEKARKLAADKS